MVECFGRALYKNDRKNNVLFARERWLPFAGRSLSHLPHLSNMFRMICYDIGRVGTLTLAYLVGKRVMSKNYKYPSGHTMVG